MPKPLNDSRVLKYTFLKTEDFEFVCFDLARELMAGSEPIPDYATRDSGLLESALANPQQEFDGKLLYPTLSKQAAILFYTLIKNHPFKNGNKRIAVMGLLAHLALNTKWTNLSPQALYDLACSIAASESKESSHILTFVENQIEKHLIAYPKDKAGVNMGD